MKEEGLPTKTPNFFHHLLSVVLFVVYLNLFFFHDFGPVAFLLFVLGFVAFGLTLFARRMTIKNPILLGGIAIFMLLSHWVILLFANGFVTFLASMGILFSLQLLFYLFVYDASTLTSLTQLILSPFYSVITYLRAGIATIGLPFSHELLQQVAHQKILGTRSSTLKSLILGLVIGLPIVGFLLILLTQADPIFSHTIREIFHEEFLKTLIPRIILSGIAFVALIPFLSIGRPRPGRSLIHAIGHFSLVHEMSVVMGLVAIIFLAFLIIQWPYVFANVPAETDLHQFGVATYSEYVQRGFKELLAVALFTYGLTWVGLIVLRGKSTVQRTLLSFLQMTVIIELTVFIVSIFRRVWLYQFYHGWTLVRIYGSVLLIWLLGMLAALALRHVTKRRWVNVEAIFTAAVIVLLGFFNTEQFIISAKPPTVNNQIDYVYLSRLSSDGVDGWILAYNWAKTILTDDKIRQKPMFDEHDRKNIAHAGIIVRALSRNYDTLVKQYGTPDERKEYFMRIARDYENLTRAYTEEKQSGPQDIDFTSNYQQANQIVKDLINAVSADPTKTDWALSHVTFSNWFMAPTSGGGMIMTFNPINGTFWYELPSFYAFANVPKHQTYDWIDRMYFYNNSQEHAYERLRESVGVDNLFGLQTWFWDLHTRVSWQSDHSYPDDLSLDAPFLEPLYR